jgi:hypothetical protein
MKIRSTWQKVRLLKWAKESLSYSMVIEHVSLCKHLFNFWIPT